MKILFVVRGKECGISPIVQNQADSLLFQDGNIQISYFIINKKGLLGYIKSFPALLRSIKTQKPDIIHAHYSFCGYLTGLALQKKKTVVSLMGSDAVKKGIELFLVKIFTQFFWGKTIVKAESMRKHFGNNKIIILPNGVNFNIFKPISQKKCQNIIGFNSKKKHIVFFQSDSSRIEKNLPLANESINLLNDESVDFHVISLVEKEKVPIILNASDLLLLTSFYEGSPNIIKEAMACNIPIVTTDVGDVRNTIGDSLGCFITSFNPIEIKKRIREALLFGERTKGRNSIKHLDSQIIAQKLIDVYHDLLYNNP